MTDSSFRLNLANEQRLPAREDGRIVVFEADFSSYHLAYVRSGVGRYFSGGQRSASFLQLTSTELIELYGPDVMKRMSVIGYLRDPRSAAFFHRHNIPCLNLNEQELPLGLGFTVQIRGEGETAADYFVGEANLNSLGFIGNSHTLGHARRLREFSSRAAKHGLEVETVMLKTTFATGDQWDIQISAIEERRGLFRSFLSRLRKPAGVFCGDDRIAIRLFYTAQLMGIRVPEELAILAIGSPDRSKDPWAHVSSIVQLDHHQLGYTAARLLDEYLTTGNKPETVVLAPSGICHSQTTFRRTVGDSVVRQALMHIQKDPSVDVPTICKRLNLSRQTMDMRFRRASNTTLAKAIEIERFIQAKRLIMNPNYSLDAIAAIAGYPNRRSMRRSFYRFTQMSPQEFRNLNS